MESEFENSFKASLFLGMSFKRNFLIFLSKVSMKLICFLCFFHFKQFQKFELLQMENQPVVFSFSQRV